MNTKKSLLAFVMTAAAVLAACNEADVQPEETPFTTAELRAYALGDVAPLELGGAMLVVADRKLGIAQTEIFIQAELEKFTSCLIPQMSIFELRDPHYLDLVGVECIPPLDRNCTGFPRPSNRERAYLVLCGSSNPGPQPPNDPGQPDAGPGQPEVFITSPAEADVSLEYDGYDKERKLWYTDITLVGHGMDPEDGELPGSTLEWKTDQTDLQDELLGTGNSTTVRLYSNDCFGATHQIRLEAQDTDGNQAEPATRTVRISTLC